MEVVFVLCASLFGKAYGPAAATTKWGGAGEISAVAYEDSEGIVVFPVLSDGSVPWGLKFGCGGNIERVRGITPSQSGEVFLAGERQPAYGEEYSACLLKLDFSGSIEWAKEYSVSGLRLHGHIPVPASDGGAFLVGSYFQNWKYMLFLARIRPDGSVAWAKKISTTSSYTLLPSGAALDSGKIFIVGKSQGDGWDGLVIALDTSGSSIWAKIFKGAYPGQSEELYDVAPSGDGGCVVLGYDGSTGSGMILKISPEGASEWSRGYKGSTDCSVQLNSVDKLEDGWIVAGASDCFGIGGLDVLAMRVSSAGMLDWAKIYTKALTEVGQLALPLVGDLLIGGMRINYDSGNWEPIAIRLGQDGQYPNCLSDASPEVLEPTVSLEDIPVGISSLTLSDETLSCQSEEVSVNPYDICPSGCGDGGIENKTQLVRCISANAGLVFKAPASVPLAIFKCDGSLIWRGKLARGTQFIPLPPGVYLWKAGSQAGKGVVSGK